MPDPRSEGAGFIQDRAKNTTDSTTTASGGIAYVYQGQTITLDLSGVATPTTNSSVTATITDGVLTGFSD